MISMRFSMPVGTTIAICPFASDKGRDFFSRGNMLPKSLAFIYLPKILLQSKLNPFLDIWIRYFRIRGNRVSFEPDTVKCPVS